MDAAYSGPAGFCVCPRYFPGVVRVQQIGTAVCPMQCALITHLRAGFHLPAAGLYFANIEAHVGTAVPQTFKQAEGSYACPSMRFDVGLPFVGQEPPTRSTEELLVGGRVRAPAGGSI